MAPLFNLHFEHSGFLVAVAIGICLTASWSVAMLAIDLATIRTHGPPTDSGAAQERGWLGWRHVALALAAGLGVWATHFIAMLAYRPDLLLRYDAVTTIASALAGILLVGVPLVLVTCVRSRAVRIVAAAVAGAGIWCMHALGLLGMRDCVHVFSWSTNLAGAVIGTALMAGWQISRHWSRSRPATCVLFALAICSTHFIALSGDIVIGSLTNARGGMLSPGLVAACMIFGVSVTCLASLLTFARFKSTREAEAHALKAVMESMSDGLVFIDGDARLRHFNRRFLELFAIPAGAIVPGLTIEAFLDAIALYRCWTAEKHAAVDAAMQQWVSIDADFDRECDMEDGRTYRMQCRAMPGKGVVLTFNDVSAERQALSNLTHLAYHDPLTGLRNRRALREEKETRVDLGKPFSLLLIDLDDFKRINDAFGHAVGDRLLVHVAAALTRMLPANSFVARMGGDEIAILASQTGDAAMALAETIVATLSTAVVINGCRLLPSCSIGISTCEAGCTPDDLMKRADMALYEAKRRGRRRAQAYVPGLAERLAERQRIVDDLHEAVQTGGFVLAFQPVVDLTSGITTGYEALIRWNHPTRGWIPPGIFIPIAEECGLIEDIGRWVMMEACRHLAGWSAHLHVAINISAAQLKSDGLLHSLTHAILIHGVAAERVEIEITETALIDDAVRTAGMIDRIRKIGIRVALDDFGTGFASLTHLLTLPVDIIKIDKTFVDHLTPDNVSMTIVESLIWIAERLNIRIVAEGVESEEQAELLQAAGCVLGQGYLYAPAVDRQRTTAILLDHAQYAASRTWSARTPSRSAS